MILVTGATGFLGSHLMIELIKSGNKIIALKRKLSSINNTAEIFSFYGLDLNKCDQIIWETADITDYFSMEDLFTKYHFEEVYHCAGMVSFESKNHDLLQEVNCKGTAHLVNLSIFSGTNKFCYFSSVAAIPINKNEKIVTESSKWKYSPQLTSYSISKYSGEREVWRGIQEGLNALIVNPSVIIGPGCWNSGSGKIISEAKKRMKFYTSGGSGVVDVRDVIKISVELMKKNIFGERFILNAKNILYKDLFTLANNCFGHKPPGIEVSKFQYRLAYQAERFLSVFNGKKTILEDEFLKSGFSVTKYSSEKIEKRLEYQFIQPLESMTWACSYLNN
jgi:dihydroflavonol-4-reductase